MEQFKYKARKRDGAVVYGTVNAPNEAAVAAFIRKQDMYVAGALKLLKRKGCFREYFLRKVSIFMTSRFLPASLQLCWEPVCRF